MAALVTGLLAIAAVFVALFGSHWLSPGDPFPVMLFSLPLAFVLSVSALATGRDRLERERARLTGFVLGIIALSVSGVVGLAFLLWISGVLA